MKIVGCSSKSTDAHFEITLHVWQTLLIPVNLSDLHQSGRSGVSTSIWWCPWT